MQMMGTSEQELLVCFICHERCAAAGSAYRHSMSVPGFGSCHFLAKAIAERFVFSQICCCQRIMCL